MKKKLLKSFILTMPLLFALTACDEKPENNIENKDEINVVTKYNVTFDSNGGNNVDSQELEENGLVTKPANPTKNKYTFLGWYLKDELFDFNTKIN